jgi:hypothetical protein
MLVFFAECLHLFAACAPTRFFTVGGKLSYHRFDNVVVIRAPAAFRFLNPCINSETVQLLDALPRPVFVVGTFESTFWALELSACWHTERRLIKSENEMSCEFTGSEKIQHLLYPYRPAKKKKLLPSCPGVFKKGGV